ncbi:proteinase-activated receptor 2 [Astyanax mexicanus]|uniref:proteinase-activated receptor 2 n=1 Tax=Astyanax mexicanus TaxID=7994 RepID=UPI0020CAB68A|nr:proteinase-activated receptor 2 [Astyanax mexicanus]
MAFSNFTNQSQGMAGIPFPSSISNNDEQGLNVSKTAVIILTSNLTTVFIPVVYIIIFILGLPPNALAIWVFLFRTKKKHPASILMANLALADLLFIIMLPLKIHYHFNGNDWIFGKPLCKLFTGFFYGNMYCSTVFISYISVQRYWAVSHPFSRKVDNRVVLCISICLWVLVALSTIPLYIYDQAIKINNLNITTCHDVNRIKELHIPVRYFLTMGVMGYVVPCVVCVAAYLLMFRSLRGSITDARSNKKKKKAVFLMLTVVVLFLVCFTPSNVMLMVHYSLAGLEIQNEAYRVYIVALCLGSLNSCLDPFTYYFTSKEFREHVKNTLKCRSERSAKQLMVSFTPVRPSTENHTLSSHTSTVEHQAEGPQNTLEKTLE